LIQFKAEFWYRVEQAFHAVLPFSGFSGFFTSLELELTVFGILGVNDELMKILLYNLLFINPPLKGKGT
jgi:hypothetical protein